MRFDVLTIFPHIFDSYLRESILHRAVRRGLVKINILNIRDFADAPHYRVDDRPYGGGPGMVLKVEPIYRAVHHLIKKNRYPRRKTRIILFSVRGKKLDAKIARRLSKYNNLILICGRYEGVDERVAKKIADEEISIGDYVLSGGEVAAMVLIETVIRFIPGVLGKKESLEEIKGSYPVYTRPEVFAPRPGERWRVPRVLLGGNHQKIAAWRKKYDKEPKKLTAGD